MIAVSRPRLYQELRTFEATDVTLHDFVFDFGGGPVFEYIYDFGSNLVRAVALEERVVMSRASPA